jgi:CheY-like chemotaxis protein
MAGTTEDADGPTSAGYVLLVEDQIDNRELLAVALNQRGYLVKTAATGTTALATAKLQRPAMAVVDIGLPDMSGLEVARGIRELYGPKGVLLVALTGHGREQDRARVVEAGFDAHLVKPVALDLLHSVLQGGAFDAALGEQEDDTAFPPACEVHASTSSDISQKV